MNNIHHIFLGTPWWVYCLLAYLIFTGVKAKGPATIPVKKLFVFPAIFIIWSICSLVSKVDTSNVLLILIWIAFVIVGHLIGLRITRTANVQVDRINDRITIPGSGWAMLLVLMGIFSIKYYFGYSYATNPTAKVYLLPIDLGFSGLVTGIFLGRAWGYFRKC